MKKIALHWVSHSLIIVVATALVTACAEQAPVEPDRGPVASGQVAAPFTGAVRDGVPLLSGVVSRSVRPVRFG